jgi:7-cyano-7-deazaguanine synthase in queuosine biosynthesis
MFVDYGQWALEGEEQAFNSILGWLFNRGGDWKESRLLLDPVYPQLYLDLREEGERVGSVWGRAIALVGIAAMWAYTHGDDFDFIALGNHAGDVGPDCKPGGFDYHLDSMLHWATKNKISLLLPIKELSIEKIGEELGNIGIPFDLMYSCYWWKWCGYRSVNDKYFCPGCRRKVLAMRAAGFSEDKLYPPNALQGWESRSYQSSLAERTSY